MSIVMIALFAGLGIAMEPKWSVKPLSMHLQVTERSTAIKARGITTPQEGTYQVRQTRLRLPISGGKTVNAILREPENAPSGRAACVFVHGAGTGKAEEVYADLANALASAGITTLVQDKRLDNYTPLRRDYDSSAEDYLAGLNLLRAQQGVDARKVGLYAESEGTWIASVMTHKDRHIAFQVLTSAPVYSGRQQIAMAATEYLNIIGAPGGVVDIIPRLLSLNFAPIGLEYADFNTAEYRDTLTMPLLVNYGTIDPAMPIEQGAQRIIATANKSGNENVTVRYFAGNHQMRAGEGLFTPNLPLAEGYTQALANWVNGVTAGTKADGWATPQVAGATPHQRFAAPQRTRSGIVGSLGVLAGLMVAGPVLIVMAAILGIGLTVFSWLQTLLAGRRSVATVRAMHATPSELGVAPRLMLHGIAGLSAGIGTAVMVITGLLYGYMSAVGVSAVLVMPQPRLFAVGWVVLRIATMLLVVLFAWEMERVWYCRADIVGVRRVICVMVALGTLTTLMTLAFWGLFSL